MQTRSMGEDQRPDRPAGVASRPGLVSAGLPCADGHQFQRPRSATVDATSRARTLASDGKNRWPKTVAATQATTTAQRNRTANRPVVAEKPCMRNLPGWPGGPSGGRVKVRLRFLGGRRRRVEADDLVTPERLQKWLKTATDQAAQDGALNFDFADAGRALHLLGRSGAGKTDLYSPYRQLLSHGGHARKADPAPASVELPIGY